MICLNIIKVNMTIYVSRYSTNIIWYLPVCRGLHEWNMQKYGEAACPVLKSHKIYEGALTFTENIELRSPVCILVAD